MVAKKNFPYIIHHGDVRESDFSDFIGFDMVIGGSPCQNRSRTRKENSKIHSGLNGDKSSLFWDFSRAVKVINPRYFFLENVVSEMPEDDDAISEALGVQPIKVNSNIASAQDRERLYWTNIPYDKKSFEIPPCNIYIKDIMQSNVDEKYFYDKPFIFKDYDKKIIAELQVNTTEMCRRVYNPDFKCGTLTCISGGYQEKKVLDNRRVRKMTE